MADSFAVKLLDKEPGVTSFQALYPVKREHRGMKIGHAGTLDRFASGLMVILIGGATRLNPVFSSFDKEYIAEITFGRETDTLDPEGETIAEADLPEPDALRSVIPSFIGKQKQIPPVYSAIHVDGRRAYREARKGNDIEMPERDIEISSIDLLSFDGERALVRASVSKGTYIRSLARDIAIRAGSRGYLSSLRRLRVGPWTLEDASLPTEDLLGKTELFSSIELSPLGRKAAENGMIRSSAVLSDTDPSKRFAFLSFPDGLFGIGEKTDGRISIIARKG